MTHVGLELIYEQLSFRAKVTGQLLNNKLIRQNGFITSSSWKTNRKWIRWLHCLKGESDWTQLDDVNVINFRIFECLTKAPFWSCHVTKLEQVFGFSPPRFSLGIFSTPGLIYAESDDWKNVLQIPNQLMGRKGVNHFKSLTWRRNDCIMLWELNSKLKK